MDKHSWQIRLTILLFIGLLVLNLFAVFSPEIAFDSLWYHLTLPKLWLLKHQWYFPGGLLYYSPMPRLTETIYIPLLSWFGTVGPKMLSYLSALGIVSFIYLISRNLKISKVTSIIISATFYFSWLVSWQSGSSYIDLFRSLLEIIALYFAVTGSFVYSGVLLGLAIGTKWLAIASFLSFMLIFKKKPLLIAILVALPWFLIAYHFTGNPVYPIFDPIISHTKVNLVESLLRVLSAPFYLTFPYDDFINPLTGVIFIISLVGLILPNRIIKQISALSLVGTIISLSLNPPSSRFYLPYYPATLIAFGFVIDKLNSHIKSYIYTILILSFVFILSARLFASRKYVIYVFSKQPENDFLVNQYQKLGDAIVDSDGFIKLNLSGKKVIVDKYHNLYYMPIDFDHTSWASQGVKYDYLVTHSVDNPETYGELIHTNQQGTQIIKLK